jgi:uncharacterized protein
MPDPTMIMVIGILFLATLVRSSFGFGEALVAVPLLALFLPVEVAAPLVAVVSMTVAATVLLQDWHRVHVGSASRLIVSTFFGIPFGLLLLTRVAEPVVKVVLGTVIILFSVYSLLTRGRYALGDDRWAWIFGFFAGILGGAYGMNGPPLVIFGALRGWSPGHFRATLQGYFLPTSLVMVIAYWFAGLWSAEVVRLYLGSVPLVIVAVIIGRYLNRRLDAARFLTWVHTGLILIGLLLLAQSLGLLG